MCGIPEQNYIITKYKMSHSQYTKAVMVYANLQLCVSFIVDYNGLLSSLV